MTAEEVIRLCRYIKAACPAQAMDEFTADVWAEILPQNFTLPECRAAVIAIKQRQPYVDVSDIIAEVHRAMAEHQPHSQACRSRDCRDCVWSWCLCTCHPAGRRSALPASAVKAIGGSS